MTEPLSALATLGCFADQGGARPLGSDEIDALLLEPLAQQHQLGALAGTVYPLHDDQRARVVVRPFLGRARAARGNRARGHRVPPVSCERAYCSLERRQLTERAPAPRI